MSGAVQTGSPATDDVVVDASIVVKWFWLMERKWWSDHRNPLAARVPETAAVERQDPVRGGLRS